MKYDEFAFFNQQLAAMVRDGIPLEAALKRLSTDMQRGPLRDELQKLEADLARGLPLPDAVRARQLPELYQQMLAIGAQSNDLPAILTMLADHYQRRHLIWTKLKGLMVYPVIVLAGAFLLACFLSFILSKIVIEIATDNVFSNWLRLPNLSLALWIAPILLASILIIDLSALKAPRLQRWLRWKLPALRDDSLAQAASAVSMMLKSGVPLDRALSLLQQLEQNTPASVEIAIWRMRLAEGHGKFSDLAAGGKIFPPLFIWMISQAHENLAEGFQRAAEAYRNRSAYMMEILLYAVMPCSVLALGFVIISQMQPVIAVFVALLKTLSNDDVGAF